MGKKKTLAPVSGTKPRPTVRDKLLSVLQGWEPAAGHIGFEGLVAQALATFTGHTFRLARSGSQFGRDAATPNAPFAIAMEAKRYKDSVPLQELVGKAALAAFSLAEGVDIWVLAATIEVSEPTERKLEEILDGGGISLLTLDWPATGLPPLAVLLAAQRYEVLAWAKSLRTPTQYAQLAAGLADIAGDPAFDSHLAKLRGSLSPGLLGLDALRARNSEWCEARFADRKSAQRQFAQFLTPLEANVATIDRPTIIAALDTAVQEARGDAGGNTLVAVLGGEGAGKTWAVAKWWLAKSPRPILLLSVGRISDHLVAGDDALDMLARLAAHQQSRVGPDAVARWRRRLDRWSKGDAADERFLVLVDGLNETSGKPWSTILRDLLPAVRDLGGVLIATCRPAFWDREIAQRFGLVEVRSVKVGDYDDTEFAEVIGRNSIDLATLPARLNSFMRNPRICALAMKLLPELKTVEDLTVDRLLLEYWRARLFERGDLVGHGAVDFRNLLVTHAKDYRARPGTDFNRDEWRARSGAAARGDGRNLANDLSDIEEGRFFDTSSGTYQFRPETLHFALGLLVADEVKDVLATQPADLAEALAGAIDPVRGFGAVADVLTAAIASASLDAKYPDPGIMTLVEAWMALQNVSDEAFENLFPYIALRPEPFLNAYEAGIGADDGRFSRFIHAAARREAVAAALDKRINRWLGTWSRTLRYYAGGADRERRAAARQVSISAKLAQLTPDERTYFDAACAEVSEDTLLSSSAALYLWGRGQARFFKGLVAYAFAYTVAGHSRSPQEDLSWDVRLNRVDHVELAQAVRADLEPFMSDQASPVARSAAALALRLLATVDLEAQAQHLSPRPGGQRSAGDESADPLDPSCAGGELTAVITHLQAVNPAAYWNHMSPSSEDDDLQRHLDALVRFEPATIQSLLNAIVLTIGQRSGLALRQLAWRLPRLSPILSDAAVAAISARIDDLGANPALAPEGEVEFVTGMLVEAVLPALDAVHQLELIAALPADAPYYLRYGDLLKSPSGAEATDVLKSVVGADAGVVERTLLALAESASPISDELRLRVIDCLMGGQTGIQAAAAVYVASCADRELDEALVGLPVPDEGDQNWATMAFRGAVATVITRLGREDLVPAIPIEHLDWVVAQLPFARAEVISAIEATIARLAQPTTSPEPPDAAIVLEVNADGGVGRYRLVDQRKTPDDPVEALKALNDTTGAGFARRQRLLNEQFDRFLIELAREGAQAAVRRPFTLLLAELSSVESLRYEGWIRTLLSVEDKRALRNLKNLGWALAQGYAEIDPGLAARTFEYLWTIKPSVTVLIDMAKHSLSDLALFGASSSPAMDKLRARAFVEALDDQRIERLVLAAESVGKGAWLERFIAERAASLLPADQALALTAASFRLTNPQSDALIGKAWGCGFLGEAAATAATRYRRIRRAEHWLTQAEQCKDRAERWRYLQLVISCADKRLLLDEARLTVSSLPQMGGDVLSRIIDAAEKISNEGASTLLGARRPNNLIREMAG